MRYLGLALYAEGPTDYRFLSPLLQRLCEDLCTREAVDTVEISPMLPLDDPEHARGLGREKRIQEAARAARGAWNILFVHTDGEGDPVRAAAERIEPALTRLKEFSGDTEIGVAVIPVRETEAWAILDGDALRQVLGITLTDRAMGLPRMAREAERTLDPKALLSQAFKATNPTGRRKSMGISPYLSALGEQVALDKLRGTESFAKLEAQLTAALRSLALLD